MKHKRPFPLQAYHFASYLATPLFHFALHQRMRKGKEDKQRLYERKGQSLNSWQHMPVIWIHGASVGESLSSLTLIHSLAQLYPNVRFVMTTGTTSSASIIGHLLPQTAIHQYFPLDHPAWVSKFLHHWKPRAVLFVESEIWPNWLHQIQQQHIPTFLINARMSDKSFRSWQKAPRAIRYLLQSFQEIYAQSVNDREKFHTLGGNATKDLGNLKLARLPQEQEPEKQAPFFDFKGQPAWLVASSHKGEEEIMADLHLKLLADYPQLHTCIMPRHAQRSDDITQIIRGKNIAVTRFSHGELPQAGGVFLFDVMGRAQEFYHLQKPTLMGRSFAKGGGQNPIEAAFAGCGLLFGPDMRNFQELSEHMLAQNAAIQCADISALEQCLRQFFDAPETYDTLAKSSKKWVEQASRNILQNYLQHLTPQLDALVLS